jgi:hypothetical protein
MSCDLSDLIKAYVSKHPINPLRCVELGLVFYTWDPIIGVVPAFIVVLFFVIIPVVVPVIFYWTFKSIVSYGGTVAEFCRVIDGKGYDCVVMIKVNVERGVGRNCPDNKESKKHKGDGEQVTKAVRYWFICVCG